MQQLHQINYSSNRYLTLYLNLWLPFVFITSIVVFPQIKGTTPAYIFSFIAPFILIFSKKKSVGSLNIIIVFCLFIVLVSFFSQSLIFVYKDTLPEMGTLLFVSSDASLLMKQSLYTQTIYLLVAILFFSIITVFYNIKNDKYIIIGLILLIFYGYYEILFYSIFHESGDFLSNRFFGENSSGSLYQTIGFAGFSFMRFKSLTGEPSMYAFSILPFFIFFLHKKKILLAAIILSSLILTFSTTAVIGLIMYGIYRIVKYGMLDRKMFIALLLLIVLLVVKYDLVFEMYDKLVQQKASAQNQSGIQRGANFSNHISFYFALPLPLIITGLGFGYVRSTDFISTLLVNNGIIGLLAFSWLFLYPVYKLKSSYENDGLRIAIFITFVLMMISVPEFSYLSIWLILGIAYNKLLTPTTI